MKCVNNRMTKWRVSHRFCGIDGCDKRYSRIKSLIAHQKRIHNNPLLVCTNTECHYETRDKYLMKKHKSVHSSDSPFKSNVSEEQSESEISEQSEDEVKSRSFVLWYKWLRQTIHEKKITCFTSEAQS